MVVISFLKLSKKAKSPIAATSGSAGYDLMR